MALAVNLGLDIMHLDVDTTSLNGHLDLIMYMRRHAGSTISGQHYIVLKLNRPIYGFKQSSRVWYKKVDIVLTDLGYIKSEWTIL